MFVLVLEVLYEYFCVSCQYGLLIVGGLFGQYQWWMGFNNVDVVWLEVVGCVFVVVGGFGLVILVDVVLEVGLWVVGVSVMWVDIQVFLFILSGIDFVIGYIEDLVNLVIGNFVFLEMDVVFGGLSQGLVIFWMYNLMLVVVYDEFEVCGVLGFGWLIILDQCLIVIDEQVCWVCDDGCEIVFLFMGCNGVSGFFIVEGCYIVEGLWWVV